MSQYAEVYSNLLAEGVTFPSKDLFPANSQGSPSKKSVTNYQEQLETNPSKE